MAQEIGGEAMTAAAAEQHRRAEPSWIGRRFGSWVVLGEPRNPARGRGLGKRIVPCACEGCGTVANRRCVALELGATYCHTCHGQGRTLTRLARPPEHWDAVPYEDDPCARYLVETLAVERGGLAVRDIAEVMGVNPATVRLVEARAVQKIREGVPV